MIMKKNENSRDDSFSDRQSGSRNPAIGNAVFAVILFVALFIITSIYRAVRSSIITIIVLAVAAAVFFILKKKFPLKSRNVSDTSSRNAVAANRPESVLGIPVNNDGTHEISVVKLTTYKSAGTQRNIARLAVDDLVRIDEEPDSKGTPVHTVYHKNDIIGRLPKSCGNKVSARGYHAACIDCLEHDEESGKLRPVVKIFW